jgi:multidrug efflux system outer membrane protein
VGAANTAASRTRVLGPLFGTIASLPLIDGGRNQANLDRSYAALEEAVSDCRQRVSVAFAEAEDSLVVLRTLAGQADAAHDAEEPAAR